MSYTNTDLVRRHLVERYPVQSQVINQAVVMAGDDEIVFYGGPIEESSLVVKSVRDRTPSRVIKVIEAGSTVISAGPVVSGSVTVASDSSLGTIYTENEDYVVDPSTAMLRLKSSGRLEAGMTVVIWYLAFVVYRKGVDYSVDAAKGTIHRLLGGEIASSEQVYLDYRPVYSSLDDDLLQAAVTEANGLIERAVDPDKQFGADPVLQMAASCRALEIICHTAVTRDLSSSLSNDRTASVWMKLADHYSARSDDLLRSFRPPVTNISKPTLS